MKNLHQIHEDIFTDIFKLAILGWNRHATVEPNTERRLKIIGKEIFYPAGHVGGEIHWVSLNYTINTFGNETCYWYAKGFKYGVEEFNYDMVIME